MWDSEMNNFDCDIDPLGEFDINRERENSSAPRIMLTCTGRGKVHQTLREFLEATGEINSHVENKPNSFMPTNPIPKKLTIGRGVRPAFNAFEEKSIAPGKEDVVAHKSGSGITSLMAGKGSLSVEIRLQSESTADDVIKSLQEYDAQVSISDTGLIFSKILD